MEWISVKERLPDSLRKVIIHYKDRHDVSRRVMAEYVPPYTVLGCDYYDDSAEFELDYKDGEEEGYVKESWNERIDNWDEFASCEITEGVVTHWMPLPKPPQG